MQGYWQEERVRQRAYEIWQRRGCPEGQADEHWAQAEAEIASENQDAQRERDLEHEGAV